MTYTLSWREAGSALSVAPMMELPQRSRSPATRLDGCVARLDQDPLVRQILLPVLTSIAAAGVAVALALPGAFTSVLGFRLLGVGTALVVPATFSDAGRLTGIQSGPAVAAVAAFGWMGYLLGPPLIGHLATLTTPRAALIVVPALMLTTALVSRRCQNLTC